MQSRSQLLLGMQSALAVGFALAVVEGGVSLGAAGISITRLAHDWIAGVVLAAVIGSCLIASLSLARLLRFHRKHDVTVFVFAFVVAVLAISPFATAPDGFSLNGNSPAIVTYPVFLWLACLFVVSVRGLAHDSEKG